MTPGATGGVGLKQRERWFGAQDSNMRATLVMSGNGLFL